MMTDNHDDVESLQRQLTETRENLRLMEEREAQYVLGTDVPLQLVKEKRRLQQRIADLEAQTEMLSGGRSPHGIETAGKPAWNTAAIRELLTAAFDDQELTTLCFDHFRTVYEDWAVGMSKGYKIQRLLDHCERHDQLDKLLALVRELNPTQYARFEKRLQE